MARYVGTYQNDFGVLTRLAQLEVYQVNAELRSTTDSSVDLNFLPPVFLEQVTLRNSQPVCDIPSGTNTIRHAKAWTGEESWLHIPCPWRPDAVEFVTFHQQLLANPQFLLVEHVGERLNPWYTKVFSG